MKETCEKGRLGGRFAKIFLTLTAARLSSDLLLCCLREISKFMSETSSGSITEADLRKGGKLFGRVATFLSDIYYVVSLVRWERIECIPVIWGSWWYAPRLHSSRPWWRDSYSSYFPSSRSLTANVDEPSDESDEDSPSSSLLFNFGQSTPETKSDDDETTDRPQEEAYRGAPHLRRRRLGTSRGGRS